MKLTNPNLLLVQVILAGLACSGIVLFFKQIINHELSWCGLPAIIIESGFYCALGLCFVFIGYLTALIFHEAGKPSANLIIMSAGSSVITGFVWLFFMPALSWYNIGNGTFYYNPVNPTDPASLLALFPQLAKVFFDSLPTILVFLLGIAGLGVAGALIRSYEFRITPWVWGDPGSEMPKPGLPKNRSLLFVASIMACVFLPAGISIIGAMSGTISCSSCETWSPISMNVTRSDNATITIVMSKNFSDHSWVRICPVKSRAMQIFVDERDFSNQSVIYQQGLTDMISPPEGIIKYEDGSSVTISGPDVRYVSDSKPHLMVISNYDRNNPWVVVDTTV